MTKDCSGHTPHHLYFKWPLVTVPQVPPLRIIGTGFLGPTVHTALKLITENHTLASSFLHPSPDSRKKRHCSPYITSYTIRHNTVHHAGLCVCGCDYKLLTTQQAGLNIQSVSILAFTSNCCTPFSSTSDDFSHYAVHWEAFYYYYYYYYDCISNSTVVH